MSFYRSGAPAPHVEESFDVVDAEDRVVSTERRAIVHQRGLRHRAVHILLQNAMGEVLLQRRSPEKDLNPDCWDSSCSGHLHAGEDYDTAALRELSEELGIAPPVLVKVVKLAACPPTGQEFIWVYRGLHNGPFLPDPKEITDTRFVSPGQIDRMLAETPGEFSPAFAYLWGQVGEQLKTPPGEPAPGSSGEGLSPAPTAAAPGGTGLPETGGSPLP